MVKKLRSLKHRKHQEPVLSGIEQYEYVDLYQIFEYLRIKKIGKKTPFIKYNDYGFANPFILISKSAVDQNIVNKELLLTQWTNPQLPAKKFNGLQVKRYIKNIRPHGSPLFTTLNLFKYGRILLSAAFKSENRATFGDIKDCIDNCGSFIQDINQNVVDYRIRRSIPIDRKIEPPSAQLDKDTGIRLSDNCTIAYMNYYIDYTGGESINLKDLLNFCKLFPSFISLNPNKGVSLNSIQIRFNRVSGFANLDEIMEEIYRLKRRNVKNGFIIKYLQSHYGKTKEECSKYLIDYKKYENRTAGGDRDSDSKIGFVTLITKNSIKIHGVKNMRQVFDTYRFMTLFMTLYLNRDYLKKNPTFQRMIYQRDLSKTGELTQMYDNFFDVKQDFTIQDLNLNLNVANEAQTNLGITFNLGNLTGDPYGADEGNAGLGMGDAGLEGEDGEGGEGEEAGSKIRRLMVGNRLLASNDEIGTDVQLTCEDAIPELDTCADFCNDEKYFIRRLQRHDNKLFFDKRERIKGKVRWTKHKKYSKSCQKFRQPVVLAYNPENGQSIDTFKEIKRESYSYSIKYGSSEEIQNWYICPRVWCPYCMIPIPMDEIDPKTITSHKTTESRGVCTVGICPYGDHQVFIRDKKLVYPGFQENPDQSLCLPCCFTKPQDNPKYGSYRSFKKCLGEEVSNENIKENTIYILGKSIPLEKSRFGVLHPRMEMVLNSKIPTGYLSYNKGYLRRGIKHESHNSFLSAIAHIFSCDQDNPRTVEATKQYIVDKIDEKLFRSLYGGNLINLFFDPHKNITPLQNYKNFILSKNIDVDHTYLWDLIQRPGIISQNGINLFIFEEDLLCPVGENVAEFYDMSRKTIILSKHRQYYEPIYYVEGNGKQAKMMNCTFENTSPEIQKIFEIAYDGCKSSFRVDWKSVVFNSVMGDMGEKRGKEGKGEKGSNAISKESIVIDYGMTLVQILKEIMVGIKMKKSLLDKYLPRVQYVDSMNKVFGIGLRNGLFLPVAPSKIRIDLPGFDYQVITNYADLPLLRLEETVRGLNEIAAHTTIPVKIRGLITDPTDQMIVGLMTEKNRIVCVKQESRKGYKGKLPILSEKFYTDLDMFIHDGVQLVDDRIIFMNQRKFEDETYVRLKFELARYLQDHPDERERMIDVIYQDRKIEKKRGELEKMVLPIMSKLIDIVHRDIDYDFYERPNQRMPCHLRKVVGKEKNKIGGKDQSMSRSEGNRENSESVVFTCDEDPHCSPVGNSCRLYVNEFNLIDRSKKNLNIYIPMMIEELIRFTLKRNEILNDQIPSIINKDHIRENIHKYYIINTMDPIQIYNKVDNIFMDKEGLYIDRRPIFDTITTKEYVLPQNKYTLVNTSKLLTAETEEVPEMWKSLLGTNFVLLVPQNHNKRFYSLLELLIKEIKRKDNTNSEEIEMLDVKGAKSMILAYIENPKNRAIIRQIHQKINNFFAPLEDGNGDGNGDESNPKNKSGSSSSASGSGAGSSSSSNNGFMNDPKKPLKEYVIQMYVEMNERYFRNITDYSSFKYRFMSDEYEGCDLDIALLAHIFKFNFIILNRVKKVKRQDKMIIYGNEGEEFKEAVLMLRNNNVDNQKYQFFQIKNKGLINRMDKEYPPAFMELLV